MKTPQAEQTLAKINGLATADMDERNIGIENSDQTISTGENLLEENLIEKRHVGMGPVLAALIVVLALILAGLYLWGAQLSKMEKLGEEKTVPERVPFQNQEPETPRAAADAYIFETTSPSDELSAIEADLESTRLDSLTDGLDQAERELVDALELQ